MNGEFSNLAVPASYLFDSQTMRVRVVGEVASAAVESTLGFPHSRSLLIQPKMSSANEQSVMNWRIQKADYQPSGYFAPAGVDIELWVWGNANNITALIGIQGMADRMDPSQQSASMRPTRLVRGRNVIRDPLGGVIHFRNLIGGVGATRIVLGGGAIPIPYYIHGVTSASEWHEMLRTSTAPEVELVGRYSVVAAFRATALKFTSVGPGTVVDSHELILRVEAEVSGLNGSAPIHTRSNLLIYAVESRSTFSPHATTGYIGLPYSGGSGVYAQALIGGTAANRWVTLHEYGHHYQNRTNAVSPFGEVSVNLYSLAVGRVVPNEYTDVLPNHWPDMQEWLAQPRSEKAFDRCPYQMAIYEQLRKGLGEGFLPAWDRYIRENPCQSSGLKCFVLSASIAAGHDLANFFADWGVINEAHNDIWQAVAELGLPQPAVNLIAIRPYV